MKAKVRCIKNYHDIQLNKIITTNDDPFIVNKVRAEELVNAGVCEVIETFDEPKAEEKKIVEEVKTEEIKEVPTKKPRAKKKK